MVHDTRGTPEASTATISRDLQMIARREIFFALVASVRPAVFAPLSRIVPRVGVSFLFAQ